MKYLKIDDKEKGLYLNQKNKLTELDKINKDDILFLVEKALTEEEFEMDDFNESELKNPAHKVIYEHLYEKLKDIRGKKDSFADDISNIYKDSLDKYKIEDTK